MFGPLKTLRLDISPQKRFGVLLFLYASELSASLWLAYELRFDFEVDRVYEQERFFVLLWLIPLQLTMLWLFHQLKALLEYFSTPDLARLFQALAISSVIAAVLWIWPGPGFTPPRGVIVLDFVLGLVGLTGVRLGLRRIRESARISTRVNGVQKWLRGAWEESLPDRPKISRPAG